MKTSEYETMYRVEDVHWWYRGLRAMLKNALENSESPGSLGILDVGCGTGANLGLLSHLGEAIGVDISRNALRCSSARGLTSIAGADACCLPFADEHFDYVVMMDVLYHKMVPDKLGVLSEARRVLKPGGTLLLNVPAYQWLFSSHDEAIHTDKRFTRSEVRRLLQSADLAPIRVTYWNTLLFPPIVLLRLWRRGNESGESDLGGYSEGIIERTFGAILGLERLLLKLMNLPFGLSIFATARKPEHQVS